LQLGHSKKVLQRGKARKSFHHEFLAQSEINLKNPVVFMRCVENIQNKIFVFSTKMASKKTKIK